MSAPAAPQTAQHHSSGTRPRSAMPWNVRPAHVNVRLDDKYAWLEKMDSLAFSRTVRECVGVYAFRTIARRSRKLLCQPRHRDHDGGVVCLGPRQRAPLATVVNAG